jgi:hypothetical protein
MIPLLLPSRTTICHTLSHHHHYHYHRHIPVLKSLLHSTSKQQKHSIPYIIPSSSTSSRSCYRDFSSSTTTATTTTTAANNQSSSSSSSQQFIKHVGILGAGQMGTGIAYISALYGQCDTILLYDISEKQLQSSIKFIEKLMTKDIEKGKINEKDAKQRIQHIQPITSYNEFLTQKTEFIIEAVSENFSIKEKIFQSLVNHTHPNTILASNTSSISITKIAACTQDADRASHVIGMHFMNPVPVMKLCEVITGLQTSKETLEKTIAFGHVYLCFLPVSK